MSSFGAHLRQQREIRGISLDQIVATTKIGRRLLVALEEEQFDLLPGGIFNKSYVRAYAKCIGIDEDEAVAQYLEAANEVPANTRLIAQQHASIHSERGPERSGVPLVVVLVLLVLAIVGIAGWRLYQQHKREQHATQTQMSTGQPALPHPNSAATTPAENPSLSSQSKSAPLRSPQAIGASTTNTVSQSSRQMPEAARQSDGLAVSSFEVTVRPKDRAWVSIKSDGKYLVRGIIQPPQVKTIRASNEIVLFTGNAGAVDVDFNGKSVPLTGGPDQQSVLVFGPHGLLSKAGAP